MGFSRFESVLGLTVLALGLVFALPRMKAGLEVEQGQRAQVEARSLAITILDYHRDTGQWPQGHDGLADLAALTAPESATGRQPAQAGLTGTFLTEAVPAEEPAWLKEIPLDPWGQPYLAFIPSEDTGMILVVSTGENGILETSRDQLDSIQRGGRRKTGPVICGDDISYLIQGTNQTGKP